MSKTTSILFLIQLTIFFACNNSKKKEVKAEINIHKTSDLQDKNDKIIKSDTLYKLLDFAKNVDTLEFQSNEPFLYIKTGNLFSKKEKSAILVNCATDTTYNIKLYSNIRGRWIKSDEISNLDVFPMQYEVSILDYNFDGFKDIYLNSSSSQGYSLSRGHLLTVNPNSRKFERHLETRNLANLFPDTKTKSVAADDVEYLKDGNKRILKLIYKWENGKLKYLKKEFLKETY